MANHKSAIKRHEQSLKRNERNRAVKTRVKNVIKAVREAVAGGDMEAAREALKKAASVIDKASTKKVLHWKTASRKVARLAAAVKKAAD